LDQAESLTDLIIPGFNFHGLQGIPERYSIHVNGPWCITFEWEEGEALRIGKFAGNGPGLWMHMQQAYDLWYAEHRMKDELSKIETVASAESGA